MWEGKRRWNQRGSIGLATCSRKRRTILVSTSSSARATNCSRGGTNYYRTKD